MVAAASEAARAAVVAAALASYRTARGLELATAINLMTARA
jgi:hypothetical protein